MKRLVVLAVAALGALVLPAPGAELLAQQATPPRVSVSAARAEPVTRSSEFVGRGEAVDIAAIVARVDGFVQEVLVASGASVEPGQLLFRIEPDRFEASLMARRAERAKAEADLQLAKIELSRTETLVARQAKAESELDVARARAAAATAAVQGAEASVRQAELDLSYTEVLAPFPGRIGGISASRGELVGPGTQPLAHLVRQSPIYVTFALSERQLIGVLQDAGLDLAGLMRSGRSPDVHIVLPNGSVLEERGRIVFIDNRIDPATGTIALRAQFENRQGLILDGGFLTVRIATREPTVSLLIPQGAAQRDRKGDFVLVVGARQTVEQRYVTLGDQVGVDVVVEEGLVEGEAVIVEGLQKVSPGARVEAVRADRPAPE